MHGQRKNALVTGSANGIGRAIAVRLAREGWNLALADIDEIGSQETLCMVESAGGTGHVELLDVTQPQQWLDLCDRLRAAWEQIDLLVNNAGVCGAGEVGEFTLSDWQWLLEINLHGVVYGCHTLVPWLKENPSGSHIINTASLAGFLSAPSMSAYNVAKAGVISLSETLYSELAPQGVGVSVLCPGFVPTRLLESGRFCRTVQRKTADGYMARARLVPEDIAEAAVRAMDKKQLHVVLPARARFLWRWKRLSPLTFLKIVASGYRRALAAEENSPEIGQPQIIQSETATTVNAQQETNQPVPSLPGNQT